MQDTEFPGINVNRSEIQRLRSEEEAEYSLIRTNVETTKLIQIGLTIADERGRVPHPVCTWQFNFKFDHNKDKIVLQSFELLKRAGVQFDKLISDGIDLLDFAEYFEASGFVFNPNVKWVVFHGCSDFAYLLRLVRNEELPPTIE
jgi:CCR4-NOT transcription complex subunit 7/8